jgi:beta-N-acetylhexosaminidase
MSARTIPLGPLMLDIAGAELDAAERRRLTHPLVGGVVLFSRNYAEPGQLVQLTAAIRALRNPPLVIGVDHEGGRVQRFRAGFTAIPPMRELGRLWDAGAQHALHVARATGFVLAAELRAHGVDLTFAPVLDIDHGTSGVIGDRALHSDPGAVAELARALVQGLRQGGMSGVGKHFPGHGYARADSHYEMPVDNRSYEQIEAVDLVPFRRAIGAGLGAVMPAHVLYPRVDGRPAGFSPVWLKRVLRGRLGFDGVVFSDDLSMAGASAAGGMIERARAALAAGCDMVLVCNDPEAADALLKGLDYAMPAVSRARLARLHGRPHCESMARLREDARYARALEAIAGIGRRAGELPL